MRIFITGATGLIGMRLTQALLDRGDHVLPLSRRSVTPQFYSTNPRHYSQLEPIQGDPCVAGPWIKSLENCDAIIHLAGESIFAKRWNEKFLKQIEASRVESTELIADSIRNTRVKTFLSASAIGYYGANPGDQTRTERSPPGADRMAKICQAWESASHAARDAGIRTVNPRIGIVLDPRGGALPKMMAPIRLFFGGPLGSGRQFVSWIHHEDLTGLFLHALDHDSIQGPMNCCAPNPVNNAEFTRELARSMRRPCWLPTPRWIIRIAIGRAVEIVAGGQRAIPTNTGGYQFRYAILHEALRQIIHVSKQPM